MSTAGLRTRTRLGEKGRIVIPADMRKALGVKNGDVIELQVQGNELRISTLRENIRRVQERAARYVKPGVSMSEELSAERREAARNE